MFERITGGGIVVLKPGSTLRSNPNAIITETPPSNPAFKVDDHDFDHQKPGSSRINISPIAPSTQPQPSPIIKKTPAKGGWGS
ncbi:hypothetical protein PPL_10782 [Heterostelium album PN500]|uniref:Uncharacterized protein n=1 Tax=Heterostelium pallidum (strain ATCC 26659 / Pp 5 / PN500) TaxID=670386 RepID=D3BRZ2_HETP5|nr:hypothetical protein PPL_10782 [Heterostelium album PN500]EFA75729.1 hypothetical protein PPL_10782 [Heterostelium album PN500]|eukprot:XP_020427863.1 hypothetical protein PPL_10782 [Heterostelium album PN500]